MEPQQILQELTALQGKSERIKNFPYPRQFATLNSIFVWIFIFLIPFGIMNEFEHIGSKLSLESSNLITQNFVWVSVPFAMIISFRCCSADQLLCVYFGKL